MKKKNILIFGAGGLIGKEIIKSSNLNNQFNIIGLDIKTKSSSKIIKVNTLNYNALKTKIIKINKKCGKIYGCVNLTFPPVLQRKNPPHINSKIFSKEISNHICSYFNTTQILCDYFVKNKIKGKIINFSSIYGTTIPRFEIYKNTGMNLPLQYSISKHSIITLSKYFSKFYLKNKININTVSPGGVINKQNKLFLKNYKKFCSTGMLKKSDLNGAIEFLLSDSSKNIFGHNLIVDDGFTL